MESAITYTNLWSFVPADLEALLLSYPKVSDAAMIGVPYGDVGEASKAYLVRIDPSLIAEDKHQLIKGILA